MTVRVIIPMSEYVKPNGFREVVYLPAECANQAQADKFTANLALLHKHHIDVTGEIVSEHMCNVCLDDGDFDYKFELFEVDGFVDKVRDLVLDFDEADYLRAKSFWQDSEIAAEEE